MSFASPQDFHSPVLEVFPHNDEYFMLAVTHPHLAECARPGQFAMLRIPGGESLLRRPFSVWDTEPVSGRVEFFARVLGRGTRQMRALVPGQTVDVLGPLGQGFDFSFGDDIKRVALVGGGTGIGGLFLAARKLKEDKDLPVHLFYGGRSKSDVHPGDFARLGVDVKPATEDGSLGKKGLVTDALRPFLENYQSQCAVLCCGPNPMMKAVEKLSAEFGAPVQNSLEAMMACGVGVCLSCVVETKSGKKRVCSEGPVFEGGELIW